MVRKGRNIKPTKKSPKEIIESDKDPSTESAYIKFTGRALEPISGGRRYGEVVPDFAKLNNLLKTNKERDYLDLHTHPYKAEGHKEPEEEIANCPIPSSDDVEGFIKNKKMRCMAVAQRDEKTGEVGGYVFLRKKKDYQKSSDEVKINEREKGAIWRYASSENKARKIGERKLRLEALKNLKNYDEIINYRFIPAKGYELDRDGTKFVKKSETIGKSPKYNLKKEVKRYDSPSSQIPRHLRTKSLIDILARQELIIVSFIISLFFLSPNLTGNVVGNLSQASYNWIGGILFVIGLVGVYFKVRK